MSSGIPSLILVLAVIWLSAPVLAVEAEHAAEHEAHAAADEPAGEHHEQDDGAEDHHDDAGQDQRDHDEHAAEGHDGHEDGHGDEHERHADKHAGHDNHGEENEVHLSQEQIRTLGIKTRPLEPRMLNGTVNAPGEVRLNAYATAQATPRIAAQVIERHARLGEMVTRGQPLVTLSSVEMAQAQGELVVAEREWRRVRKLGRKVVSEKRYLQARVNRQQARAKVIAYGMQAEQVEQLAASKAELADGSFRLLAPRAGTVIRDDFILGELVEPGRVLFEITDEHTRWIEARLAPEEAMRCKPGDVARVRFRDAWLEGRVSQIHHALDESTRTQAVRIELPDPDHRLHPGVFVDVTLFTGRGEAVLAVPESALLRSPDGHWQLFVRGDGEGAFVPVEVDKLRTLGGLAVIRGLAEGTEVVVDGSFFLASELAKGGFDPHNH